MSPYEELVERCAKAVRKDQFERLRIGRSYDPDIELTDGELHNARALLAEVFRTLETVTPEMLGHGLYGMPLGEQFVRMLRASPLAPPKEGESP